MKRKLPAMLGPAAAVITFALGLLLAWSFAATLIGSMCALLAGSVLAALLMKKRDK